MANDKTIAQAQQIFTNGKFIHDHVFKIQATHLSEHGHHSKFGELSIPQFYVIQHINSLGEVYISELAEMLNVSPPSASAMVDRLVGKGILVRKHCVQDRRKVTVQVSPKMQASMFEMQKTILKAVVEIVEEIGPQKSQKWCDVLDCVKSVLLKTPSQKPR